MRPLMLLLVAALIVGAFQAGRALPAARADAAEWETVGELDRPRAYARAVSLSTGEILVVGGLDPDDPQVTSYRSELIEPRSGRITALPQPLLGRLNQTVTVARGGQVVVAGGTEHRGTYWAPVDRVEVFDPRTRQWRIAPPLHAARGSHAAVVLRDGRVLVAGGNVGSRILRSAEVYDPATDRWQIVAPLPVGRTQFSFAALPDGRILAAGGFGQDGMIFSDSAIYDPGRNTWSRGPAMLQPRLNHAQVILLSGDVLYIAGEGDASGSAERYDVRLGRFVDAGRIAAPRVVPQAGLLPDGRVLLSGGLPFPNREGFRPVEAVEMWDPRTGSWSEAAGAPTSRAFGTLVTSERGLYRVSGSHLDERPARSVERVTVR